MPCPHNEISIVQRSQQQSAIAAVAYQSGEKLFCESPIIEWVDWVNQSENDENEEAIRVEVHFEDGTEETFEKGITLRQIWHEDVL